MSALSYTENQDTGNRYRCEYLSGLKNLLDKMDEEAAAVRRKFAEEILKDPGPARKKLKDMLGWPLNTEPTPVFGAELIPVTETEDSRFFRLQLEVFEGVKFYGVLTLKKTDKPLPLVICQHGGEGAAEMICGFLPSSNYNDLGTRIAKRKVHTFCPQLQLWNPDTFGGKNRRFETDARLRQLGGSVTAFEIYCISRCLDYFETLPEVNGSFGMAGLSYGGFYTLITSAVETRIKAAHAVGFFNSRSVYPSEDWAFNNAAYSFYDAELGALVYPRALWVDIADEDYIFNPAPAIPESERLSRYYSAAPNKLKFRVFHGTHEYPMDDSPIDFLISNL
ncbi:MAG: hypothetical protein IKZ19_05350 [Clostridia bacterium]|nr:hypothetical protein [Clostridia bacterium]